MARRLVGVLLAVMMTAELHSQTAQRALFPVKVNETARGEVFAYIDGEDVLIARSFLEDLQIPLDAARVQTFADEAFVSLLSLAPRVTFAVDLAELTLALTVDPLLLGNRVLELRSPSVIADRGGDPGIFLNYGVIGQASDNPGIALEVGANRGHRFAYTGVNRTSGGEFTRGLSYYNIESPRDLRRLTFGDAFVGTDILGGSVTMGGVTLSRQFALQPYFVRTPSLNLQGTATTPSVVEIYINGQLTNRISVDPGVFTLQNLPATGGLGNTRLVVRDAFGRETVLDGSFYYSAIALRRGLSDYVFSVGSLREDLASSFEYEELAGLGQYRRGITDALTLGGRAEASPDLVSFGPSITYGSRFGDFDLGLAASSAGGARGSAGTFTYRFSAPRFSFGASSILRSDRYATLSLPPAADRSVIDLNVFAAANIRFFNLGVTAGRNEQRDGQMFERLALQSNTTIGRRATIFTSLGATRSNGDTQPEIIVGLTLAVGRETVNLQTQRTQGQNSTVVQVRRPVGLGNGFGYSLQADTQTDRQLAILDYQTSFGRYQVTADPEDLGEAGYNVAGGLVYLGGQVTPARPVENSYALARVGVPGVELFASNQSVGRTDRNGDLLIPNLLPHYENQLRVNDKDIPLEYVISGTEVTVVPPTRGGVIARFAIRKLRSYTGRIVFQIIGEPFEPSLGEVVVEREGEPLVLGLGRSGEFYVEDLDAGNYKARLRIGKVYCDFPLVLPDSDEAITDLGVITCEK